MRVRVCVYACVRERKREIEFLRKVFRGRRRLEKRTIRCNNDRLEVVWRGCLERANGT